jgi:hypothetical protein
VVHEVDTTEQEVIECSAGGGAVWSLWLEGLTPVSREHLNPGSPIKVQSKDLNPK